mmetsp:Transcript_11395/g.20479  ORF Transcript_11395/g.20479 Transcript_11395/m.20479 type:complete len:247 (+) Transcript_11395:186-926(+)
MLTLPIKIVCHDVYDFIHLDCPNKVQNHTQLIFNSHHSNLHLVATTGRWGEISCVFLMPNKSRSSRDIIIEHEVFELRHGLTHRLIVPRNHLTLHLIQRPFIRHQPFHHRKQILPRIQHQHRRIVPLVQTLPALKVVFPILVVQIALYHHRNRSRLHRLVQSIALGIMSRGRQRENAIQHHLNVRIGIELIVLRSIDDHGPPLGNTRFYRKVAVFVTLPFDDIGKRSSVVVRIPGENGIECEIPLA